MAILPFDGPQPPAPIDLVVRRRRAIVAAIVGNALEWYDFAVFGFFTVTIGKLFFPAADETTSLLYTAATFGVGFFMRPVGALLLGAYADRAGRKAALSATILLMAFGTTLIGLAPTRASAGWLGTAMVVVARLIQGLSAGGELGSSTAFLVEHADPRDRGLAASWQQASQAVALLLGSLIGAGITGMLSVDQLESWGWRLPFLVGMVIGPVGFYIRSQVDESASFAILTDRATHNPISRTLTGHSRAVVVGFGLTTVWAVCNYFFLVYMPTYAVQQLHLPQSSSLLANGLGLAVVILFAPLFGGLSDRVGRKPLLLVGTLSIGVLTYPLLALLSSRPGLARLIEVQAMFGLLIAIFTGPAPAALAELFPTDVRSTGLSIAYNFAVTVFGGFAPFIATWLIARTADDLSPSYYVVAASAVSLVALFFFDSGARATDSPTMQADIARSCRET